MGYYVDYMYGNCKKCFFNCIICENEIKCIWCKLNFYGERCNYECNKNCVDGLCEINGICIKGCNNFKFSVGCFENCSFNCMYCYSKYSCEKCLFGFYIYGLICIGICFV